jgi:hypothetical protein
MEVNRGSERSIVGQINTDADILNAGLNSEHRTVNGEQLQGNELGN